VLKACVDTNIWLSGIIFQNGAPAEIVQLALKETKGSHKPIGSHWLKCKHPL
jgi:predicted nucleic acid-binding protein